MNTSSEPSEGELARCPTCGVEVCMGISDPIRVMPCPSCGVPIRSRHDTVAAVGPDPGGTRRVAVSSMWDTFGGQPEVGRVFLDRYQILNKLSTKGGGVWLVRHLEFDINRVLRVNLLWGFGKPPRSWRESIVGIPSFSHPHLVEVHDVHAIGEGVFVVVTEHVDGLTLDRSLMRGMPKPPGWVARILEQLCDGLQAAHDRGLVHRDLKPSALFLVAGRPEGQESLKISFDFDEPGWDGTPDPNHPGGWLIGAFPYASPEVIENRAVDARSDIYSVGVILYELLTGIRPFSGPMERLIHDVLYTPPPPFKTVNPAVNVALDIEQVVLRCLAKDSDDRPQSARALAEQFLLAVTGTAIAPPKVMGDP